MTDYQTALTLLRQGAPDQMRLILKDMPEVMDFIEEQARTIEDLEDEVDGLRDKISVLED